MSASTVADTFAVLMIGFPTGMAALVLERALIASQLTRPIMFIAIAKLITRTTVAVILGRTYGVVGIAAAQPASSLIDLVLLTFFWSRYSREVR
jgi:peptidoglycan biosynthesis protein MviN/MurJ (putative lipid II flippase)